MASRRPRSVRAADDAPNPEPSNAVATIGLPAELLDVLAERVADVLVERGLVAAAAVSAPESWLNVADAAAYLACPRSRVYSLVSARRIPHEKDGSRLLFKRSALDDWLTAGGARRP